MVVYIDSAKIDVSCLKSCLSLSQNATKNDSVLNKNANAKAEEEDNDDDEDDDDGKDNDVDDLGSQITELNRLMCAINESPNNLAPADDCCRIRRRSSR